MFQTCPVIITALIFNSFSLAQATGDEAAFHHHIKEVKAVHLENQSGKT